MANLQPVPPKRIVVTGVSVNDALEEKLIQDAGDSIFEQVKRQGQGSVDLRYNKQTPYGDSERRLKVSISEY